MPPRLYSRFALTAASVRPDGSLMLSEYLPFRFAAFADNVEHVVQVGETYFSIAGHAYSALPRPAGLYWVICDFQVPPVVDATILPAVGSTLYLPSSRTVTEVILNSNRRVATLG